MWISRDLSEKLDIKLATWKRWSREFLPPDPTAGLQSGATREFADDDAFTVYLGGYLVQKLKFSIPDARQILYELGDILHLKGFYPSTVFDFKQPSSRIIIEIYRCSKRGFEYRIKHYLAFMREIDWNGEGAFQDIYKIDELRSKNASGDTNIYAHSNLLIMEPLLRFMKSLGITKVDVDAY